MVRAYEDPPSHGDPPRPPPLPRVTSITPPGVIFDEDALVRYRPVLIGARARFGRFATGPLLRRRPSLPRLPVPPGAPRAHWHMPAVPFTRSPVMRSPMLGSHRLGRPGSSIPGPVPRAPLPELPPYAPVPQAPSPLDAAATWWSPLLDRLFTLRRKQRP